jgi:hypothetical protein
MVSPAEKTGNSHMSVLSRIFGRTSSTTNSQSTELEAVFKKLHHLMTDDKAQIEWLPKPFLSKILSGSDCDVIVGAMGEFGRDPRNPIPVNGPLGGVIYLSNLLTANSQNIMFHRLGSVGFVDVYETVSLDGSIWDILFCDQYHPRKSRRAPAGYRIAEHNKRNVSLFGSNIFVSDFPVKLPDAIANTYERFVGVRMRPPQIRETIERIKFRRSPDHQTRLNSISLTAAHVPSAQTFEKTDTRNAKSLPDHTGAGKVLGRIFFEPDIWHEMLKLRAPDGLVTSEVALARIAIIRDAIRRLQPHTVATPMLAGVDQYVGEAFKKPEQATTATLAIRLYEQNVSPLTQLAEVLARRLLISGVTAVEIAPVLKEAAAEAEQLMKAASALQKFSELPDTLSIRPR